MRTFLRQSIVLQYDFVYISLHQTWRSLKCFAFLIYNWHCAVLLLNVCSLHVQKSLSFRL